MIWRGRTKGGKLRLARSSTAASSGVPGHPVGDYELVPSSRRFLLLRLPEPPSEIHRRIADTTGLRFTPARLRHQGGENEGEKFRARAVGRRAADRDGGRDRVKLEGREDITTTVRSSFNPRVKKHSHVTP